MTPSSTPTNELPTWHLNTTVTMADVMRDDERWAPKRSNQWTARNGRQSEPRKEASNG
jgi:hypothetical protein